MPEFDPLTGNYVFSGTSAPGDTVTIISDGAAVGTATVDEAGNWTIAVPADAISGDVSTQVTDAAGNVTFESEPISLGPQPPRINPPSELQVDPATGEAVMPIQGGGFTWTGQGAPGSQVVMIIDGARAGVADVDAEGGWSLAVDLPPGSHTIQLNSLASSGEVLAEGTPFTVVAGEEAAVAQSTPGPEPTEVTAEGADTPAAATEAAGSPSTTVATTVAASNSPTAPAETTVTSVPAATAPGETPAATVVVIGVTTEPPEADASATSGAPVASATAVESTATAAPFGGGGEEAGGGGPETPEGTSQAAGYPVSSPAAPESGYPGAETPPPPIVEEPEQQVTPVGPMTETPVGGATPNQPGTPTATVAAATATPTEASATETGVPTSTATPSAEATTQPDPAQTATTQPTATATFAVATSAATTTATATTTGTVVATTTATIVATALPTATVAPPPTTLPQTGLGAWGVALLGFGLILVVFAARRLRRA
jgi:hypothetical protein